jgi:hypothetical protein
VGRAGRGEEGIERLRMKKWEKEDWEREVGRRGKEGMVTRGCGKREK